MLFTCQTRAFWVAQTVHISLSVVALLTRAWNWNLIELSKTKCSVVVYLFFSCFMFSISLVIWLFKVVSLKEQSVQVPCKHKDTRNRATQSRAELWTSIVGFHLKPKRLLIFLPMREPFFAAILVTQLTQNEESRRAKTSEGKAILNFGIWLLHMKTSNNE